eukprot:COSAG02_NODE_99_length_37069_cov_24.910957_36_plen_44_part_00
MRLERGGVGLLRAVDGVVRGSVGWSWSPFFAPRRFLALATNNS